MRIDVFSDTVCPWCYIGKRRLERALAERPDVRPTVHWRAFQLNPDMPPEGMERREYLETKFGGAENARRVYDRVAAEGERESIRFRFGAIRRTPNTLDSHRLIRWAEGRPPGQDALVDSIFRAYFERGEDIGDRDVLLAAATESGHDPAAARSFLEGDEERGAVELEDMRARMSGINGVPCFILGQQVAIPGAADPQVFLEAIDRVLGADTESAGED